MILPLEKNVESIYQGREPKGRWILTASSGALKGQLFDRAVLPPDDPTAASAVEQRLNLKILTEGN